MVKDEELRQVHSYCTLSDGEGWWTEISWFILYNISYGEGWRTKISSFLLYINWWWMDFDSVWAGNMDRSNCGNEVLKSLVSFTEQPPSQVRYSLPSAIWW